MQSPILDIRMLHHTGIGVYLQGLLEGMAQIEDAPKFLFYGPIEFRPEIPERLCDLYFLRNPRIYSIREQVLFPEELRFHPLFHSPHYNIPLRFRGNLVVTIHDLNHLVFPGNLPSFFHRQYARFMFGEVAARAKQIIVISEHIRSEAQELLKIDPDRITLIHYAINPSFGVNLDPEKAGTFRNKHKLPDQYLLAVGIYKPHKNYPFLLNALRDLRKSGEMDIPLVIAGLDQKGLVQLKALAVEKGVDSFVNLVGSFSRAEAPYLYSSAAALVFPSLYEGFGLPPLEAMKMNVPVIASNRPPIPEVAGDAALFFDPKSPDEFKGALLRLLSDSNLRANLVEKGRANLARFDWVKTARQTLEVYRKAAEQG
ncbi:glycosyltransferase family 4 protein [Candidatus Sumerlaeota bacterium]|nr:glycosyltransferase family 4 protein [Candidatus Sumerlaeota bacterium]